MPAAPLHSVLRRLRGADQTDADLLERFLAHRDGIAFELLARRHGPMILGVCRRVLRHEADAEDAFQATFLVFVRKAATILPRANVGNWLYGVAHKTALKARAMNDRRRLKEREAGAAPARPAADDTWASLLEILDGELSALPDKYRTAIVLCDLEGLPYRQAAAQLGCPRGTLSGRLTRGRALLARRLARRGLPVPAGALAAALARDAVASVPPPLLALAVRGASGPALPAGVVSPKIASLTEGVLKMMLLAKLKVVTGGLLFVAAVVAAGWLCATQVSAQAVRGDGEAVARTKQDRRPPAPQAGAAVVRANPREAEFLFLAADGEGKTVTLVVSGTSAPVLRLPVTEDLRVIVGGRSTGPSGLRRGVCVTLRMDAANRAIQEMRVVGQEHHVGLYPEVQNVKEIEAQTTAKVLRTLPKVKRGIPGVYEVFRDNVTVETERLVDHVDPPRFFPLVGPARLHHLNWKCTVRFTEVVQSNYPFPFESRRPRVEVVYIDTDYLIQAK